MSTDGPARLATVLYRFRTAQGEAAAVRLVPPLAHETWNSDVMTHVIYLAGWVVVSGITIPGETFTEGTVIGGRWEFARPETVESYIFAADQVAVRAGSRDISELIPGPMIELPGSLKGTTSLIAPLIAAGYVVTYGPDYR